MRQLLFVLILVSLLVPSSLFACAKGCVGGECGTCTGKTPFNFDGSEEDPKSLSNAAISTTSLEAMINAKVPMALIDARSGGCEDGLVIPTAKNIPDISTDEEIQKGVPDKNMLVVLYDGNPACCARKDLKKKMEKLGYTNLIEYPAGIVGWTASGRQPQKITISKK